MLRTAIPSFDSPIRRSWLRTLVALAMLAATAAPHWQPAARIYPLGPRVTHWTRPHQGKQEMARRRRQIERGMLTGANGLAVA